MAYLWIKTFHTLFVIAWMACVFYLPRILVNLAETHGQAAVQERVALMGRRLYRFGHVMFAVMLALGLVLWLGARSDPASFPIPISGWLHAKTTLVFVLLAYFLWCGRMLKAISAGATPKSSRWYRWFNELPLLLAIPVIYLVIAKPF
jgi:putative membrane protein